MAIAIQDNLQKTDIEARLHKSIKCLCETGAEIRKKLDNGINCKCDLEELTYLAILVDISRCYTSLDELYPERLGTGGFDNTDGDYNILTETEILSIFNQTAFVLEAGFPIIGTIYEDPRKTGNKVYVNETFVGEDLDTLEDENGDLILDEDYPIRTEDGFIKYANDTGGTVLTQLTNWQSDSTPSTFAPYKIIGKRDIPYRDRND